MDDLISRKDAINALKMFEEQCWEDMCIKPLMSDARIIIGNMPSAETEIIRCCKCVYWKQDTVRQNSNDAGWWNEALCEKHTIYGNEPHEVWVDADWYCADAERRTDE